ncbi:hypothetical protein McanMca71_001828 [Microsporum canis]|uniref:Cell wall galactomannoprotein n=1 Tax=Arthroderma otae (strain ATCC MYA-4605 / CBS 113480) TaxID=554155 RepID=C5FXC6_ARTOC|nr:uncharacterized protein MCYG_07785 [Microsporum canis CBS 113480]EEQ34966.1 predicted protein [Microsporum canis CBS 113480]
MLFSKVLVPLTLCLAPLALALSNEANTIIDHTAAIAQKYEAVASSFDAWGGGIITVIPPLLSLQNLHNAQVAAIHGAQSCGSFTPEDSDQIMESIKRVCTSVRKAQTSVTKKSPEVCATGFGFIGQAFVEVMKSDMTKFLDIIGPKMSPDHAPRFTELHQQKESLTQEIIDSFKS